MRAKFGHSNGLKSGGKMAGIGSDPNYGSGGSNSGSGTDINELGATAFSFVSGWVDTVSKVTFTLLYDVTAAHITNSASNAPIFKSQTTAQLLQENSTKSNTSGGSYANSSSKEADPWAAIATGTLCLILVLLCVFACPHMYVSFSVFHGM